MMQINNAQARLYAESMVSQNASLAREKQYNNKCKIKGDTQLEKLLLQRSELAFEIAKAKVKNGDFESLEKFETKIESEISTALKKYNLKVSDLETCFACEKCGDTGKTENGDCDCFKGYVLEYITKRLSVSGGAIGFEKSAEFAKNHAGLSKFYAYAKEFISRYPSVSKHVFFLQGHVGCGKTHLAKEILAELIAKGASGLCVSSFNMEELFVSHMQNATSFNPIQRIKDEYNLLMNIDVLVVDDLGAEIIHMEKIKPYFVSLLESRIMSGKLTIFTTNLSEADINKRYGERFFSRGLKSTVVMKVETDVDLRTIK